MLSRHTARRLFTSINLAVSVISTNISKQKPQVESPTPVKLNPEREPRKPKAQSPTPVKLNPEREPRKPKAQSPTSFKLKAEREPRKPEAEPPALIKLKTERDPDKLFNLFQANSRNRLVVENRFAFEDTVSRLAGARRFDYIEQLLEHQKALPQGRREGFIVRIIMLYGKAGMPNHALKTFYDMHLHGCPRTVKSFNATLKVLLLTQTFDTIRPYFYEAPEEFGIQRDEFSFNLVIKALCEMGSLDSAYLMMIEMEKAGIRPDVVTYTTLISAFYKCDRRVIADGLWNLMVMRKCLPNLATFNVRIQYLVNKGRAWQARSLMQKMVAIGINPDELTLNLIIKGFCRLGNLEMAKKTYDALHSWGCKPNSKIYQTMIHYLCEEGEFVSAFRMCKDSMTRNWFPSVHSICKLLEVLMKNSKDRNAWEIIKLVRRRVPPYSVNELKAFEDILSRDKIE
ncbi:tetratricopeptide repeat (TPR)-like superfamily protein [Tasmannia lanceolata]|uniref:tetratricopeptide repeat (TPR)-like superfamily protein n=1 Tax=Tasmannia lanceolata TaxID=3420 RepID=UPI0040630784